MMLVEEGGADGEPGGDSPSSSAKLQLVGVLGRGKCSGAAAATGWEGRIDGARGRLARIGLVTSHTDGVRTTLMCIHYTNVYVRLST